MTRRNVKLIIIIGVILTLLVGISVAIYITYKNKSEYHVIDVDKTEFTKADFVEKSSLKFYSNGTFHVTIEHKDKGLSLAGIGTYEVDKKIYHLTFTKAYARDNEGNIVEYTNQCDNITCLRTGNRIKFTDHKNQIFYFG
ncbi:MAG: hypothetical protein MJ054_01610 [Clostridia bacterium]|nr:hypothetical protein [Clostridia bacterium]